MVGARSGCPARLALPCQGRGDDTADLQHAQEPCPGTGRHVDSPPGPSARAARQQAARLVRIGRQRRAPEVRPSGAHFLCVAVGDEQHLRTVRDACSSRTASGSGRSGSRSSSTPSPPNRATTRASMGHLDPTAAAALALVESNDRTPGRVPWKPGRHVPAPDQGGAISDFVAMVSRRCYGS
jgi:hypothetical protein